MAAERNFKTYLQTINQKPKNLSDASARSKRPAADKVKNMDSRKSEILNFCNYFKALLQFWNI